MGLEDFNKLVLPVKNKLYRFALSFMGNREEAEDVTQDVLLKLWNQKDKLSSYLNIEAWCMRLIKNQSLDRLKSSQFKTRAFVAVPDVEASDKDPYQRVELENSLKNLRRFIDALPVKQKQIIHLRDVEGFSYQEIADIMEVDQATVKVNLFRARTAIRTKLLNVEAYGTR